MNCQEGGFGGVKEVEGCLGGGAVKVWVLLVGHFVAVSLGCCLLAWGHLLLSTHACILLLPGFPSLLRGTTAAQLSLCSVETLLSGNSAVTHLGIHLLIGDLIGAAQVWLPGFVCALPQALAPFAHKVLVRGGVWAADGHCTCPKIWVQILEAVGGLGGRY
jgi:hypothetical protein